MMVVVVVVMVVVMVIVIVPCCVHARGPAEVKHGDGDGMALG